MKPKIFTLESDNKYQQRLEKTIKAACPNSEHKIYDRSVEGLLELNNNGADYVIAGMTGGFINYHALNCIKTPLKVILYSPNSTLPNGQNEVDFFREKILENKQVKDVYVVNRNDPSELLEVVFKEIIN